MGRTIEDAVREACLWLPETEEKTAHGMQDFRVKKKVFATHAVNHHGDGRIALWLNAPPDAQELYVDTDPEILDPLSVAVVHRQQRLDISGCGGRRHPGGSRSADSRQLSAFRPEAHAESAGWRLIIRAGGVRFYAGGLLICAGGVWADALSCDLILGGGRVDRFTGISAHGRCGRRP